MGFFSSKSSRKTNNTSNNSSVSFGIGGDNNGVAVNGNNNTLTDFNAVESAFDFAGKSIDLYRGGLDSMMTANTEVSTTAINAVGMANDGANALSELAIMQAGENSTTFMSLSGDIVESNANLANTFGDNLSYLTDSVIDGNFAQTSKVLDNNNFLIGEFAQGLERSSMRESALMQQALSSNTDLSSQFGTDIKSLSSEYGSSLADMTGQTQTALLEMAQLQEAGLNNALDVASSIAMDDNSEASISMVKSVMLGVGAIAIAMVMKK